MNNPVETTYSGQVEPTTNLPTRVIRALWYFWRRPELGRHEGTLERFAYDPLVSQAMEAIKGGDGVLAAVYKGFMGDDQLRGLLALVDAYPPPQEYIDLLAGRPKLTTDGRPLADEFWPDREPVMVAPAPAGPLSGKWPSKPGHTCQEAWRAEFDAAGLTIDHWTGRAWRGQICEACYYDRVFRLCRQVEHEAAQGDFESFKHTTIPDGNFPQFVANVRAHRQRHGRSVCYMALPQFHSYFIIHNDPDIEGEALPSDRAQLFDLVAAYADTWDGRRLSSSKGWGGSWAGTKGDGRAEPSELVQEKKRERLVIMGRGIADLLTYVEGMGYPVNENGGRYRAKITPEQFIELLEIKGSKYYVIEGQAQAAAIKQGLVTHNGQIEEPNNYLSLMRDTTAVQETLIPPEPAPVYL